MTNIESLLASEAARKATNRPSTSVSVPEIADPTLTDRAKLFVVEYMRDKRAGAAYLRAGYSAKDAHAAAVAGCNLLQVPKIRAEVDRLQAALLEEARASVGLTLDKLYREIARGAFYDIRKLVDAEGNPLPLEQLDDETASAIESVEIETRPNRGEDKGVTVIRKYKMARRSTFVDMGMKALNGYKEDREAAGAGAVNALAELLGGMRRSALPVVRQVEDDDDLR